MGNGTIINVNADHVVKAKDLHMCKMNQHQPFINLKRENYQYGM